MSTKSSPMANSFESQIKSSKARKNKILHEHRNEHIQHSTYSAISSFSQAKIALCKVSMFSLVFRKTLKRTVTSQSDFLNLPANTYVYDEDVGPVSICWLEKRLRLNVLYFEVAALDS